ncbi:MAG: hypothetical protein MPN21_14910 [Thermoanaerobaculia bacterium]|nr:hypothetical protein [Thermoanaerobaculia bacterium]
MRDILPSPQLQHPRRRIARPSAAPYKGDGPARRRLGWHRFVPWLFGFLVAAALHAQPFAYVSEVGGIAVIDVTTRTVVDMVATGSIPTGVAVNPEGTRVYVASAGLGRLAVIDTATNTVVTTVAVPSPFGVVTSPDGSRVYVVSLDDDALYEIDATSNLPVAITAVGQNPTRVDVTPDGLYLYVTNGSDDTVSVIDSVTRFVVDTIAVGVSPEGVTVGPDGRAYVVNSGSESVSVIDTDTNSVVDEVLLGAGTVPNFARFGADGLRAYVTDQAGTVLVIDATTNTVADTVAVGSSPFGLAVIPGGTELYVADPDSDEVSVIDTTTNMVIDAIPLGEESFPRHIAIGPAELPSTVREIPTLGRATMVVLALLLAAVATRRLVLREDEMLRNSLTATWFSFFILLAAILGSLDRADADVFEVDRFDDPFPAQTCDSSTPMDCSLREAILTANASAGPDLIRLPAGFYSLTRSGEDNLGLSGDLDVTDLVRIEGAGQDLTVIDGGGEAGLGERIFDLFDEVELADLTIRGGHSETAGGGIYNRELSILTLERVTLVDNEAPSGGGLLAAGHTTVEACLVVGNRATASGLLGGGGILTASDATTTTILRSRVSANAATVHGGGIEAEGPVRIIDSTVELNDAPEGGGLYVRSLGDVAIEGSTLFGNDATFAGGAISSYGALTVTNSTISGNHAATAAGGVLADGELSLVHTTISRNTSAVATAVMNTPDSTISYQNTILDGSCNAAATVTSLGGNLESPGDSCLLAGGDQVGISTAELNLSSLNSFGGPTRTHLPLEGSVAVDWAPECPSPVDQRGTARPLDGDGIGGAACDAGAVEVVFGTNSEALFQDGFESGNTSAWSGTVGRFGAGGSASDQWLDP